MLEYTLIGLKSLVLGTIPAIVIKILYVTLLIVFFINVVSWTYRRALCVFDAGWASYSIRNLFRLVFCLIFDMLCIFSLSGTFITTQKFLANPYMIFVISVNALYTVTMLGSSYLEGYKKARIVTNTLIFSSWCISIVSLYFLSIRPSNICILALHEKTLWEFGLSIYKKLNPFYLGDLSNFYSIFFTVYINLYNIICMLALIIFTKLIPKLKNKLMSFKYIFLINITVLIRDILYYILQGLITKLSPLTVKIIGSSISILLIVTTLCFIKFIQCEGKYDKNLKKKQVKEIKKDLIEIISDFENAKDDKEFNFSKKRLNSLLRRIEILNIKIDITKYAKFNEPCVEEEFLKIIQKKVIH